MPDAPEMNAGEASEIAAHRAKSAQEAVELARELQLQKMVDETVGRTKDALLEGLKEVFGDSDNKDPEQMRVLVRRIPILCTQVLQIHEDIGEIKANLTWGVRIVLGAVITAILGLAFVTH